MKKRTRLRLPRNWRALGPVLAVALCACGTGADTLPPDYAPYTETGDLDRLREKGFLRILMPYQDPDALPRRDYVLDLERDLAEELARELGLTPVVIPVADRRALVEDLREGNGDLAVARLTATRQRRATLSFSVPLGYVRELLVCRADEEAIDDPADLDGRWVAVRRSSSYYDTILRLKKTVPGIHIVAVPEHLDTEQILYRVAVGEYDVTVADEDIFTAVKAYRNDLKAPFALTGRRPVGWAMRHGSERLKEAVDRFLHEQALIRGTERVAFGDIGEIRDRRVLRVLTRNNAVSYFLYRGRQMGFEFELARRFANELECRMQIIVPPSADLLIPWLLEGKGDLIAASMTATPERRHRVAFTRYYKKVREMVVGRADDDSVRSIGDLAGRTLTARRSSSYYQTLMGLQPQIGFKIEEAPEDIETEELIAEVASGERDLTVADSDLLDIELTYRDDVRGFISLGGENRIAWAVRPDDVGLLETANRFLDREYRGTFYNVIYGKYFENRRRLARMAAERMSRKSRISPYDELLRRYARMIEVDWRLLAAQAYQESRFDPRAVSWAGAIGLMQVLPDTALELGIDGDLTDPETGIRAGALYFRRLQDQFEPTLPRAERVRFALAAYNAGRGHVLDGRRLAREKGLDPDRWFEHVETVFPLLSKAEYARKARFGYCRGQEAVDYVRQINDRYAAYTLAID